MKKLKFLSLALLITIVMSICAVPSAFALEEPSITAGAAVLLDAESGTPLLIKNGDEQVYPASTTKIMTVLLALEAADRAEVGLSDYVTASENSTYDLIDDGSSAGIVPGETMTLENLLYCAMLKSANESCNIIAEYVAGDIPSFISRMNDRAAELGCTGTHFTNTHGLPDANHYTTANDFAKIAMAAIKNPMFMQICNTASRTIPSTNKSEERKLLNSNGLINPDSEFYGNYYYEGAEGIKTGHTSDAGYCLVASARRQGLHLLSVVMGSTAIPNGDGTFTYNSFTDTITLYDWAFNNFSYRNILNATELIEDLPVSLGSNTDTVSIHPQESIRALLPNDEDLSTFQRNITVYSASSEEELVAPIRAGEILGEISVSRDGIDYGSMPLIASSGVDLSYSEYIKSKIAETMRKPVVVIVVILIIAMLVIYAVLVVRYTLARKQQREELERRRKASVRIQQERESVRDVQQKAPEKKQVPYFDGSKEADEKPLVEQTSQPKQMSDSDEERLERDYFEEFFGKNSK